MGRTTTNLERAIYYARRGERVVVLGRDQAHADELRDRAQRLAEALGCEWVLVSRGNLRIMGHETPGVLEVKRGQWTVPGYDHCLPDHSVYETAYPELLKGYREACRGRP